MPQASAIFDRIRAKLIRLYGPNQGDSAYQRLVDVTGKPDKVADAALPVSERDIMLITYGDQVQHAGENPLHTLHDFLDQTLASTINHVHILPFYPYSSDDGFSVVDYRAVNPLLGDWGDIAALSTDYGLMFDAVFNHISAKSTWFQAFLRGEPPYRDYFVTADPATDLSAVVRPRALPLLTPFQTPDGEKHVWTTFSDDQVDLNAANPDVLLELIDILLFYVHRGARFIRLDAIAFLWKVVGTSCIHLEETHLIIQLMRDVLDLVAPHVVLITETNVPHEENISYFGDGANEAQMVYQFPLPPLILHTFRTGDTSALTQWASTIHRISEHTTFFNFTASHDGIGLRPVADILTDAEIQALVQLAQDHGGHVAYKTNSDGSQSPYELNITYFDAITNPATTRQSSDMACQRFICSQAIMLAFIGVPGVYFHSLYGSRNFNAGVDETGHYRTINREKLDADAVLKALEDSDSIRSTVYHAYTHLLDIRKSEPAFHPLGQQQVLNLDRRVFALERTYQDARIIALHNVTGETFIVELEVGESRWNDRVHNTNHQANKGRLRLQLAPYQIVWLAESIE
jgi:sucrose phosphorylase